MADDADRLARQIAGKRMRLLGHLPELDPLRQLPDDDDATTIHLAVDLDLAVFQTPDGSGQRLAVEGIRERADLMLYVAEWRRLYCLANDGDVAVVADGDAIAGEVAWAAVYRDGELVAHLDERQT